MVTPNLRIVRRGRHFDLEHNHKIFPFINDWKYVTGALSWEEAKNIVNAIKAGTKYVDEDFNLKNITDGEVVRHEGEPLLDSPIPQGGL